jgi:hypothetical protein
MVPSLSETFENRDPCCRAFFDPAPPHITGVSALENEKTTW